MRFYNIFFSPTGGTEKVADIVAKGTKLDAEEIDLIKEPDKLMKVKFEKKDLCLVAVPSYGGRIPAVVTDMFCKVKADGTKAILVAVFGNRMIDDTLLVVSLFLFYISALLTISISCLTEIVHILLRFRENRKKLS